MDYNIRGVIYLVGLLVNYITGMGIKSIFHNYDSTAVSQGRKGQFQRTPVKKNWPINPWPQNQWQCRQCRQTRVPRTR